MHILKVTIFDMIFISFDSVSQSLQQDGAKHRVHDLAREARDDDTMDCEVHFQTNYHDFSYYMIAMMKNMETCWWNIYDRLISSLELFKVRKIAISLETRAYGGDRRAVEYILYTFQINGSFA